MGFVGVRPRPSIRCTSHTEHRIQFQAPGNRVHGRGVPELGNGPDLVRLLARSLYAVSCDPVTGPWVLELLNIEPGRQGRHPGVFYVLTFDWAMLQLVQFFQEDLLCDQGTNLKLDTSSNTTTTYGN